MAHAGHPRHISLAAHAPVRVRHQFVIPVHGILRPGRNQLLLIADAFGLLARGSRSCHRRKNPARENGNDRNHHQQLDQ